MTHAVLFVLALFGSVSLTTAEERERLAIAAVTRSDRVSFEGDQHAQLPVAGFGIACRVWRSMRVEGEFTMASGESRRSYEGDFVTYADPGSSPEEILRKAVIARRTNIYKPGIGGMLAVAAEASLNARASLAASAGMSFRRYRYVHDMTILHVPEGVTFAQAEYTLPDARGRDTRGGLMFALGVPIRTLRQLHVTPEVRWVWGGPARVGNNYDEGSVGTRVSWKF
jgi:hypothetical protein